MDQVKIGRFIAELRKEKGLTQASLAGQFGISNKAVSKWENGKSLPDASIMLELCNLLDKFRAFFKIHKRKFFFCFICNWCELIFSFISSTIWKKLSGIRKMPVRSNLVM